MAQWSYYLRSSQMYFCILTFDSEINFSSVASSLVSSNNFVGSLICQRQSWKQKTVDVVLPNNKSMSWTRADWMSIEAPFNGWCWKASNLSKMFQIEISTKTVYEQCKFFKESASCFKKFQHKIRPKVLQMSKFFSWAWIFTHDFHLGPESLCESNHSILPWHRI